MRQNQEQHDDAADHAGQHFGGSRCDRSAPARHPFTYRAVLAPPFIPSQDKQDRKRRGSQKNRFDQRHRNIAVELRVEDLDGQDSNAATKNIRSAEARHRRHERYERRPNQRRHEHRQRDACQLCKAGCAKGFRGLFHPGVQPLQAGRCEHEEVNVHAVGVHEENRGNAVQVRPWMIETESLLEGTADNAAFAVKEEKCNDTDQRRQ